MKINVYYLQNILIQNGSVEVYICDHSSCNSLFFIFSLAEILLFNITTTSRRIKDILNEFFLIMNVNN